MIEVVDFRDLETAEDIPDGVYANMPMDVYLALPLWSGSLVKIWREHTPAYARWTRDNGTGGDDTAATSLGTLAHACVLEPDTVRDLFVLEPRKSEVAPEAKNWRATKAYKEKVAELEAAGRTVVKRDAYREAVAMKRAVRRHLAASTLLTRTPGGPELTVIATDPDSGVRARIRPDYLSWTDDVVIETNVKTTRNAEIEAFSRDLYSFGYFVSFAFYQRVLSWAGFHQEIRSVALAIDSDGPRRDRVAVYELDEGAIGAGLEIVDKAVQEIGLCEEYDVWPGHPPGVTSISLPHWAWRKVDDEVALSRDLAVDIVDLANRKEVG